MLQREPLRLGLVGWQDVDRPFHVVVCPTGRHDVEVVSLLFLHIDYGGWPLSGRALRGE